MELATVLIVDDHDSFRKTLRDWLAALLPEVTTQSAPTLRRLLERLLAVGVWVTPAAGSGS